MTVEEWASALTIVALAAAVQGLSGFGFGVLSMPLLALIVGPHEAVVVVLTLAVVAGTAMLVRLRPVVDASRMPRYLILGVSATPIGVALFHALDATGMQIVIGMSVTVVGTVLLLGPRVVIHESRFLEYGSVFLGGAMTASTGMGAAPVVLYAASARLHKARFRATLTAYGVAVSATALLALWLSGAAASGAIAGSLSLIVGLGIGLPAGMWLHGRVSEGRFEKVVSGLLLVMGVISVARAF